MKGNRAWVCVVLVSAALGCGIGGARKQEAGEALPPFAVLRFVERASVAEKDLFIRRTTSPEPFAQMKALQMILFRLTPEELSELGIEETRGMDSEVLWRIAVLAGADPEAQLIVERAIARHAAAYSRQRSKAGVTYAVRRSSFLETRSRLQSARRKHNLPVTLPFQVRRLPGQRVPAAWYPETGGSQDRHRQSCLHKAVEFTTPEGKELESTSATGALMERLLAEGADIEARDSWGWTPLYLAVWHGHIPTFELLLRHGADVNAITDLRVTPLMTAAIAGYERLAWILVGNGARVDARDEAGNTALHYAASRNPTLVRFLVQMGADARAENRYGKTPAQRVQGIRIGDKGWTEEDARRAVRVLETVATPDHFERPDRFLGDIQALAPSRIGTDEKGRVIRVSLRNMYVTDRELLHVGRTVSVQELFLDGTNIGNASVQDLSGMAALKQLELGNTGIDDSALRYVKDMLRLTHLNLEGTKVAGPGLAHLRGMAGLAFLDLSGTPLGDEGLAHIEDLAALRSLNLNYTNVTDAGLVFLKGLNRLERLYLYDTDVTDNGLRHIHGIRTLRYVNVRRTRVTALGVKALRARLPEAEIAK